IYLWHIAYQSRCRDPKWERAMTFTGSLPVRKAVRVHSGASIPLDQMYSEDARGVDYHVYTGINNYIWNNACGDTAVLFNGRTNEDSASYDPHPPDGAVLRRLGDKLVP